MQNLINVVIIALIGIYAGYVIRKSIKKVKAGKCMSCSIDPDEQCHCHRTNQIMGIGEEEKR